MRKLSYLLLSAVIYSCIANAQTQDTASVNQKFSDLSDKITDLQNESFKRSQFKINGFIQAQYQVADSEGINTFAGGNFLPATDKRFTIRRGRIKMDYSRLTDEGDIITQGIVQIDFTQNGLALRDAYANILDPHTKWIGLKVGVMDKPFGYEVTYGDAERETPERARMSQILFPGEKDLGAQIYIMPNKNSIYRFFKLEAGMYNGTGALNNDFDKYKDFISRLSFFKNNSKETIRYSGGISYYNGGHKNGTKYVEALQTDAATGNHFWNITDSATSNLYEKGKQVYYGADAQVSIHWKGGLTTLRAEYIMGTQAGTAASTATPKDLPVLNTFQRNFNGAYFYWVQNIANTKHNIVIKYDWYDPNTDVKGSEIGAIGGSKSLTAADIKYSTLSIGYYFNYDQNWRFTAHADIVKNERTQLANYGSDLKDNVLTLQVLYKF